MHLTPENAPVGATVAIRNGIAEMMIKIRQWDEGHFRAIWPDGMHWRRGVLFEFVRRIDQPEPVKPSPGRLDAWPTVEESGNTRVTAEDLRDLLHATRVGVYSNDLLDQAVRLLWHYSITTKEDPELSTPGDSVTIERDRAAMDALRRLAAKAMGISVVSDDVNVKSLEAVVQARLGCIERELSVLHDLRRASERLPGEGDVVEWNIAFEWAYEYLDIVVAKQSGRGSPLWQLATDDDRVVSFSVKAPHPDLHPVRVDGVWRWVRKEKV